LVSATGILAIVTLPPLAVAMNDLPDFAVASNRKPFGSEALTVTVETFAAWAGERLKTEVPSAIAAITAIHRARL
jgi:hypothetical protein